MLNYEIFDCKSSCLIFVYTAANIVPEIIIVWWMLGEFTGLASSFFPQSSPAVDIPRCDFGPCFSLSLFFQLQLWLLRLLFTSLSHGLTHSLPLQTRPLLQLPYGITGTNKLAMLWRLRHGAASTFLPSSTSISPQDRHAVLSDVMNSVLISIILAQAIFAEHLEQGFLDSSLCPSFPSNLNWILLLNRSLENSSGIKVSLLPYPLRSENTKGNWLPTSNLQAPRDSTQCSLKSVSAPPGQSLSLPYQESQMDPTLPWFLNSPWSLWA